MRTHNWFYINHKPGVGEYLTEKFCKSISKKGGESLTETEIQAIEAENKLIMEKEMAIWHEFMDTM